MRYARFRKRRYRADRPPRPSAARRPGAELCGRAIGDCEHYLRCGGCSTDDREQQRDRLESRNAKIKLFCRPTVARRMRTLVRFQCNTSHAPIATAKPSATRRDRHGCARHQIVEILSHSTTSLVRCMRPCDHGTVVRSSAEGAANAEGAVGRAAASTSASAAKALPATPELWLLPASFAAGWRLALYRGSPGRTQTIWPTPYPCSRTARAQAVID